MSMSALISALSFISAIADPTPMQADANSTQPTPAVAPIKSMKKHKHHRKLASANRDNWRMQNHEKKKQEKMNHPTSTNTQ